MAIMTILIIKTVIAFSQFLDLNQVLNIKKTYCKNIFYKSS